MPRRHEDIPRWLYEMQDSGRGLWT